MTKDKENSELKHSNQTKEKTKDWRLELGALTGFCFSGTLFIASGVKNGDVLTIAGSLVWILSCVAWMIPYRKFFDASKHRQTRKDRLNR